MAGDPFTIRIFVPDGDPEGLRIIDRMNWTGLGIVFPREKWPATKQRAEFSRPGVYILTGYRRAEDELPTVYIGEGDVLRSRIDSYFQSKGFWDRGIVFTASNNSLNKAHVRWLESALVKRAVQAQRCILDNGTEPQQGGLSEAERADTEGFLREVLQILPLVGLRAFEIAQPVATPHPDAVPPVQMAPGKAMLDTVIVPAQPEGFEDVFLGQNCWHAIRISSGMLPKIKYIAAYRTQPERAITHYAPVKNIEPYGEEGKYKLNFSEPAKPIGPIPFADAPSGSMEGPRYTSLQKLLTAKKLTDLSVAAG
ncbi:MAG: GIY-YIG nuclease family protein [Acetobacteraceae bacterium]